MKKKLYVISGLGADFKVLEKLRFPDEVEVVFLDWLIPDVNEPFEHYVYRFAEKIDDRKPFMILGYSFGGIIAQEINRIKRAEKIVLLGSIRSSKEKSRFMRAGEVTGIPRFLPVRLFNDNSARIYMYFRKLLDPKNPKLLQYFTVRDPYYLKWSIEKIAAWKSDETPDVVQIMGDRDIVFPIRNCRPDYVVRGGSHLFPATRSREVSAILEKVLK